MTTWECSECDVAYAVGAQRCPHCGADRPREEGAENMPKISAAAGPSYAGVVDNAPVSTADYQAAQERVTRGNAENGDGALIARYDQQSARARAVDLHAAPPEIAERASADATLKAADPDASAETLDPDTGQPRLTEAGENQLRGRGENQGDDEGADEQPVEPGQRKGADEQPVEHPPVESEQPAPATARRPSPRAR